MLNPVNNQTIANNQNTINNERQVAFNPEIKNHVENKTSAGIQKKDINKINDCKTCSERKYQDVSNDGGVSFQSPTKLAPSQAATAVAGHEREHFTREQTKADMEGKEVVQNEIKIKNSICPECGKVYVSGGETTTTTKTKPSEQALNKNDISGINFDTKI